MSSDIGNITVGQAPEGIKQTASVSPAPNAPPITPIVVPATGSGGGLGRKLLFGTLIAVIFVGIIYVLISMSGDSEPTITPSPSASVSSSPSPTIESKSLRSYFGNPSRAIDLQGNTTGIDDLRNGLISVQPVQKQATAIAIQHKGTAATAPTFFDDTIGTLPAELSASLGTDWALLIFGQSEGYDASGTQTTTNGSRLILIFELSDASKANQAMQSWETSGLASSSAKLLGYDTSKSIVAGFSSGLYRQIPVRYWNFPYADQSIDYAIVTASNNKNYLVISGSREAAFFAIDQLMQ